MINLTDYGFVKMVETDRLEEYHGHDVVVTVYNYPITTFEKKEIAHNTFMVNSKMSTSRLRPASELADWLVEKGIKKTNYGS